MEHIQISIPPAAFDQFPVLHHMNFVREVKRRVNFMSNEKIAAPFFLLNCFQKAQKEFADLPHERQPEVMGDISGACMFDMLHYAYEHLEECKLILCCSEGTKFSGLIDEMVEIEAAATHAYQEVLQELGRPSPQIDPALEHILITGMFHTFFELVIHEMPLGDAENYVKEMRAFYTAGWMKIMGQ